MRGHVQVIPASINKELGILARMKEAADLFKGWRVNRAEDFFIYLFIKWFTEKAKTSILSRKWQLTSVGEEGKNIRRRKYKNRKLGNKVRE